MKYSDYLGEVLRHVGYTHYFYVGGGNIMHLTESLSRYLKGIPVIHEVAAGIAAEYFNEISNKKKAIALVTAGPGLTNIITSIAGAYLESRELLVIGGQVKNENLLTNGMRSRGIQEIDGVSLTKSITKKSYQIKKPLDYLKLHKIISISKTPRKGPVFLEVPLDVQAKNVDFPLDFKKKNPDFRISLRKLGLNDLNKIVNLYHLSRKPIILIGGGVDYEHYEILNKLLLRKYVPFMTTYNGSDRVNSKLPNYLGRPNTWGQRSANIIIQDADLIIAVGTRLGLQQTGFNWKSFGKKAKIIHVDIDKTELNKGHPKTHKKLAVDANHFILNFLKLVKNNLHDYWIKHALSIRDNIPRIEDINFTRKKYISPYNLIIELESLFTRNMNIIPCSSGSAFTLSMQLLEVSGQRLVTNKSLASMGYGLSGAIGACLANNNKTILIEGDGGFAQNMQEIGTAKINKLNLKIFIFDDSGHASIRMTQQNYFNGKYLGCDNKSGLGLPNWNNIFKGWNLSPYVIDDPNFTKNREFLSRFNNNKLDVFIVKIDPQQTYFPKISSKIMKNGSMISDSIDHMTPEFKQKINRKFS